jgi:hypothetical protein
MPLYLEGVEKAAGMQMTEGRPLRESPGLCGERGGFVGTLARAPALIDDAAHNENIRRAMQPEHEPLDIQSRLHVLRFQRYGARALSLFRFRYQAHTFSIRVT